MKARQLKQFSKAKAQGSRLLTWEQVPVSVDILNKTTERAQERNHLKVLTSINASYVTMVFLLRHFNILLSIYVIYMFQYTYILVHIYLCVYVIFLYIYYYYYILLLLLLSSFKIKWQACIFAFWSSCLSQKHKNHPKPLPSFSHEVVIS